VTIFDGVVDINDDLSIERLFEAYSFGIFPWPHEEYPVLWFSPEERGVLDFSDFHISKSFRKFIKNNSFKISFNTNFKDVVTSCSEVPRVDQEGTWITDMILSSYLEFHKRGYAHSVECWNQNGDLVGGVYGVMVGGVFSAESMFYKESSASKYALYSLIKKLETCGLLWLDIQMVTDFTKTMGAKYISRSEFLERMQVSQKKALAWF